MLQSARSDTFPIDLTQTPLQLSNIIKIADTLQGSIWRAFIPTPDSCSVQTVVVKVTSINQHNKSISIHNNTVHHNIKEDIVSEQRILKYLTEKPNSQQHIAQFLSFFKSDDFFVLVQEDGGHSLFDFVKNAHALIRSGRIDISHWQKAVHVIFKQMVQCIAFLHSHNVCHHDISLENWLINDVNTDVYPSGEIQLELNAIRVKLCDFGLSELYTDAVSVSRKYCGKTQYKSPEIVHSKTYFNPKLNDMWASAVCLFILSFGSPPWHVAHVDDVLFAAIMKGDMMSVLKSWNLSMYVDPLIIDVLQSIFKYEQNRMDIHQLMRHASYN